MDLQSAVCAPARAVSLNRMRLAIGNWETSLRKYAEVGGHIDDKAKRNIFLTVIPKTIADPLIMALQNYLTYTALKQHAMYKADLPMEFNPENSKAANLAQRGDESDDGEWPDDDLQCNLCNDETPDVVQQLLAVVRKFGNKKAFLRNQPITSTTTRVPRCLNCGSPDHKTQDCPKPEVP